MVLLLLGGFITLSRDISGMESQANYFEKELDDMSQKYDKVDENVGDFNQIVGEIKSDLNYLKDKVDKIRR